MVLAGDQVPADEARAAAVDRWLQGDDETSLPTLADLARAGDPEARLLLARIETKDLGHSPYRAGLTPKESRALFRKDNGTAFGQSWLVVEADRGNALAAALLQASKPTPSLDVIARLAGLGERQATDHPTRILALYGSQAMRQALRASSDLLPELRPYLAYLSGPPEPRGDGVAALRHMAQALQDTAPVPVPVPVPVPEPASQSETLAMAEYLALGLGFGDPTSGNPWRAVVEGWLARAPAARPIAALCQARCPQEQPACGIAVLGLVGGYYEAIRIASPLERLVSQERFLDSPRAQLMVLWRSARARSETNLHWLSDLPELRAVSQCAADVMRDTRKLFPQ